MATLAVCCQCHQILSKAKQNKKDTKDSCYSAFFIFKAFEFIDEGPMDFSGSLKDIEVV